MKRLLLLPVAAVLASCATPTVTRTVETMTPRQIADMGLECRKVRLPDTVIVRSICATPEAWAVDDGRNITASENLFQEIDETFVFNRFSR